MHCLAVVSMSVDKFWKFVLSIPIPTLDVVEANLHVVDNLVRLVHVPVVETAKDVLARSINCSAKEEV